MEYTNTEFNWEDYFTEEEWIRINEELEEEKEIIKEEIKNGELYTTEEMLEHIEQWGREAERKQKLLDIQ